MQRDPKLQEKQQRIILRPLRKEGRGQLGRGAHLVKLLLLLLLLLLLQGCPERTPRCGLQRSPIDFLLQRHRFSS